MTVATAPIEDDSGGDWGHSIGDGEKWMGFKVESRKLRDSLDLG